MNRGARNWLIAVLSGLTACGAWAADDPLAATLARMDRAAVGFTGITADFRKVDHTAVIQEDSSNSGSFLLKRPKPRDVHVLWDIKEPDKSQVSVDTKEAIVYHPLTKVETVYNLSSYKSVVNQFLVLGFGSTSKELESSYTIKAGGAEMVGAEKTMRLELTPKSEEVRKYFSKVELWISDANGLPVQQKLTEPNGDYHLATYSHMLINPRLPESALKLNLPKDVVVEYPQK